MYYVNVRPIPFKGFVFLCSSSNAIFLTNVLRSGLSLLFLSFFFFVQWQPSQTLPETTGSDARKEPLKKTLNIETYQKLLNQNRNKTKKTVSSKSVPQRSLDQHQLQPQGLHQDLKVQTVPFTTARDRRNCKKAETTHFTDFHHFSSGHIGFRTTGFLLSITKDQLTRAQNANPRNANEEPITAPTFNTMAPHNQHRQFKGRRAVPNTPS